MLRIHYAIRASFLVAATTLLLLSACSRSEKLTTLTTRPKPPAAGIDDPADGSPRLTIAPMYGRQLLASYVNVTGITPNAALNTAYEQAKDQLPQAGLSEEVSTTVVFATTALASEVCNVFLTKEKAATAANRRAFGPIDFTKTTTSLSDASLKSTANNLAKLFLSRELDDTELEFITKAKATALDGAPVTTASVSNLSLVLCTAIASSVEATQL